ncbi:MAG: hypothetical protein ACLR0M_06750 [[Clostridium] symbiosum]
MILFILSLVADGVKNRREIGNKLAGAGEECTGYRLKKNTGKPAQPGCYFILEGAGGNTSGKKVGKI